MTSIRPLGLVRGLVFVGALAAFPFLFNEHWLVNIGVFTLMYAVLATAWNMFAGYSGYISLGHVAFFGIGAYTLRQHVQHLEPAARLGVPASPGHAFMSVGNGYRPFYVLPLIGLGVALLSVPDRLGRAAHAGDHVRHRDADDALRLPEPRLQPARRSRTAPRGCPMPTPNFAVATYERPFYYAMLGVLVLGLLLSWHIRSDKLGLMLFAIREDEEKARGLGVRTTGAKLIVFALSAGLTAMAGGIWAYYLTYIYPEYAVDPLVMIGSVLPVFLGGRGTLWGPVLGALILVPAQQYMAYRLGASELYLVGYSAVFVVILLVLPRGILPSLGRRVRALALPRRARGARRRRCRSLRERTSRSARCCESDALTKRFGGVTAVDACSFSVPSREHHCADRAERLGQDDTLQPAHRLRLRRLRRRPLRRAHRAPARPGRALPIRA